MRSNPKSTAVNPNRLNLYVDESGQDTRGRLFIVAVVAVEKSDELSRLCESLEEVSGKGKAKWGKADKNKRLAYLRDVIQGAGLSQRHVVLQCLP